MNNLFYKNKSIFIHVPKCAGTSISLSLLGHQVGHKRYIDYEEELGREIQDYFIFTIVRNPISRFISAYNYISSGGMTKKDKDFLRSNAKYFQGNPNDFLTALLKENKKYLHFKPITDFIVSKNNNINLNYIHKIEEDISKLIDSLSDSKASKNFINSIKIGLGETGKKNVGKKIQKGYQNLDLDLLHEIYHEDFWRLGYEL